MPAEEALTLVMSSSGEGVYASADVLFKGAVFGRDSLKVGRDLLNVRPELTKEILLTLASFQGVESNSTNEEESGKIMHEMRRNANLDTVSQVIFDELSSRWGVEWSDTYKCEQMVYFGSVDATPSFVQLLCEYCDDYGPAILDEPVQKRNGEEVTVRQTMIDAVSWTVQKLDTSPTGLLGYRRVNPEGIENQVWKDSKEFYVHEDGNYVNHTDEVASIEVQGMAYDALVNAARYMPEQAHELELRADELRDRTIELLWNPKNAYFDVAIDRDDTGEFRQVKTNAANAACLLDSKFFDTLPAEEKQLYVSNIVRTIMGPDFLTDAGIRSRSLADSRLIPFWDYHGSYVTWPKETYDIIKGLRIQGFPNLAVQLENRMLNAVKKSDGFPEFIYVDADGRVLAGQPNGDTDKAYFAVDSTNKPENIQAWTVSSVMAVMANRIHGAVEVADIHDWQRETEAEILGGIKNMSFYENRNELDELYPDYAYQLVRRESVRSSNFLHEKLTPRAA